MAPEAKDSMTFRKQQSSEKKNGRRESTINKLYLYI